MQQVKVLLWNWPMLYQFRNSKMIFVAWVFQTTLIFYIEIEKIYLDLDG